MARGIASLVVVIFHANASAVKFGGPQLSWLGFCQHGVDFFFVLSGFIIYTAHADQIGKRGFARDYLLKRAIRLLPMLWIVVLCWALVRTLLHVPTDPITVIRSVTLIPSLEPTAPTVVWTLRHEVTFYMAFLLLLWSPVAGRWLFFLWATAVCYQLAMITQGRPIAGSPSFFLSRETLNKSALQRQR